MSGSAKFDFAKRVGVSSAMISTEAWVIHAGPPKRKQDEPVPAALRLEKVTFPDLGDGDALVEPVYGSWEANMDHALRRDPVDVCRQRGEDKIIIGNGAVVRVLRPGAAVTNVREGDLCLVIALGTADRYGYGLLVRGYDQPGSHGVLARRLPWPADLLLPLPAGTRYSPLQWAASYLRYFTAWDNWKVAEACWRAQMPEDDEQPLVFGWGGGVVLGELELAKRAGFAVAMASSNRKRLDDIASRGITPVDRRLFPDLACSEEARRSPVVKQRYLLSEKAFLNEIKAISHGRGASIVLDNIGGDIYRATMRSLARQGVISTVGWKLGMKLWNVRATECIQRHIHVHTHGWRFFDSPVIRDFMAETNWIPGVDADQVYPFEQIPQLADDYSRGVLDSYFPTYQINEL
jgi:NADPH:quinone reductase-like Zn-dependent oxidoreductase